MGILSTIFGCWGPDIFNSDLRQDPDLVDKKIKAAKDNKFISTYFYNGLSFSRQPISTIGFILLILSIIIFIYSLKNKSTKFLYSIGLFFFSLILIWIQGILNIKKTKKIYEDANISCPYEINLRLLEVKEDVSLLNKLF